MEVKLIFQFQLLKKKHQIQFQFHGIQVRMQ